MALNLFAWERTLDEENLQMQTNFINLTVLLTQKI